MKQQPNKKTANAKKVEKQDDKMPKEEEDRAEEEKMKQEEAYVHPG